MSVPVIMSQGPIFPRTALITAFSIFMTTVIKHGLTTAPYDGWWGNDTLPKLNYEGSDKLVEYILNVAKKWVSPPYSVDGWRLDVAADLGHTAEYNHAFWKNSERR